MGYEKVGYLGPEGSYTYLAAKAMCPKAELIACRNFYLVVRSLLDAQSDAVVLPIENTINGGVLQNMDLLERYGELSAIREYTLRIDHRLVTLRNAEEKNIERIYSHKQALDQCAMFLRENYPFAEIIPVDSTAAGIACIKSVKDAAIAGVQSVKEGYKISKECISDEKNNFTHFLLVVKGAVPEDSVSRKIYFSLTCNHVPGALMRLLKIINDYALNMTKIESRPIKDRPGEYRFFIEVEADYSQPEVKAALAALKGATRSFRLIGCY